MHVEKKDLIKAQMLLNFPTYEQFMPILLKVQIMSGKGCRTFNTCTKI